MITSGASTFIDGHVLEKSYCFLVATVVVHCAGREVSCPCLTYASGVTAEVRLAFRNSTVNRRFLISAVLCHLVRDVTNFSYVLLAGVVIISFSDLLHAHKLPRYFPDLNWPASLFSFNIFKETVVFWYVMPSFGETCSYYVHVQ
jgi:hypothetical protein